MPYRPDVERCDHNGLPAYRPVVIADGAFGPTTLRPSPDLRLSDRGEAMRVAREMAEAKAREARSREARLEYLRGELRAERISYEELHELQNLAHYIDEGDVELREAAGLS